MEQIEKVMAFIAGKRPTYPPHWEGYVMFVTEGLLEEASENGRHISSFLDIEEHLDLNRRYPAFMTWEGSVVRWNAPESRRIHGSFATSGKWRRSTSAEIIRAQAGHNPFSVQEDNGDLEVR